MKLFLLAIFFLSNVAFAKLATDGQVIVYAKQELNQILTQQSPQYSLLESSIKVSRLYGFDAVNVMYNYTYGLALGKVDGQVYGIDFIIRNKANFRRGHVYIFSRSADSKNSLTYSRLIVSDREDNFLHISRDQDPSNFYNSTQVVFLNPITKAVGYMNLSKGLLADSQTQELLIKDIVDGELTPEAPFRPYPLMFRIKVLGKDLAISSNLFISGSDALPLDEVTFDSTLPHPYKKSYDSTFEYYDHSIPGASLMKFKTSQKYDGGEELKTLYGLRDKQKYRILEVLTCSVFMPLEGSEPWSGYNILPDGKCSPVQ